MRTLAFWAAATGGALLGALRIHPLRNLAMDHVEMVMVNPGFHPILRALVPPLPEASGAPGLD